ncbi:LysM peptidoglycan-binding domain-containing protein [Vibrio sp. JC009]|uniref:LysM peptidoglycan-binding domain-containing protein n=1 Tax=Vibrio sp. JC009 TaxID=2912314 RepID=UPI0023B0168E|nr:LysM domain-containing protein [Vibrio sp. JC009]WED20736.1 LysM peptidoglycan-binding domain-containing protein [Vibrio sp. JC009]
MANSYTIKTGDCLSLIAEKFDLDIQLLQQLNSDQIKDIDLIYAGDTLNLPGEFDNPFSVEQGKRIPLPATPEKLKCAADLCSSAHPEYVDILYVPAHPKTGEKAWYALTKEAQMVILDEQQLLESSVTVNQQETFNNLNKLGILSKFEVKAHEHFLSEQQDRERLRYLIWCLKTIRTGAAKNYSGGEFKFIQAVAQQEELNYQRLLSGRLATEHMRGQADYFDFSFTYTNSGSIEEIVREEELRDKARHKVKAFVVKHIETEIRSLENKAIRSAGDIDTNDGTRFVFDQEQRFFTSEKQRNIAYYLKYITLERPWQESEIARQPHKKALKQFTHFWNEQVPQEAESYYQAPGNPEIKPNLRRSISNASGFTGNLLKLNTLGYVLKEQCLTPDQLTGTKVEHLGPKILTSENKYPKYLRWREDTSLCIDIEDERQLVHDLLQELCINLNSTLSDSEQIERMINSTECSASQWAYYPTLALIAFIDRTLSRWLSEMKSVIGKNVSIPNLFHNLLWVKKVALARINQLKNIAIQNANDGQLTKNFLKQEAIPASFHLIWDETMHKPTEKRAGAFINRAGASDIQAVECSLISEGKVSWVRGPCWYMPGPKDRDITGGHVKDVTLEVTLAASDVSEGSSLEEALKSLTKPASNPINLSKEIAGFDSQAFWSDSYHWQNGMGPDGQSAYSANAQAQFFRLTNRATGSLNLPYRQIKSLSPKLDLSSEASIGASLSLLSAQLSFSCWFPAIGNSTKRPAEGYQFNIPYVTRKPDEKKSQENHYDAGQFFVKLDVTVYGLAAASCQLSGNIAFGPAENNNSIGVKGCAYTSEDFNQASAIDAYFRDTSLKLPKSTALQTTAKVDAFAGVEAGGRLNSEVYWKPPVAPVLNTSSPLLKLGQLKSHLAVSAGVGFTGELRLCFQDGMIYLIASAKAICGPGASGSLAIGFDPLNVDRFLECALGVLKESGFRYVSFFGELDENGRNRSFEELNMCMTIAMALGITVTDVLLLPAVAYGEYKTEALQEEYAPVIAKHILRNQEDQKTQQWARNLPPETLAKLFLCLTNVVEAPWFREDIKDKVIRLNNEVTKALALTTVMQWITPISGDGKDTEHRCSQFEKALALMGGNQESCKSYIIKWQRFAESWEHMAAFILNLAIISDNQAYTDRKNKVVEEFNKSSRILCQRVRAYKFINYENGEEFIAYKTSNPTDSSNIVEHRNNIKTLIDTKSKNNDSFVEIEWEIK